MRWNVKQDAHKRVSPRDWLRWCRNNAEAFETSWIEAIEKKLDQLEFVKDQPLAPNSHIPCPDYCRLGNLAEELELSVDDLLDFAEKEQLEICVRLKDCMTATRYVHAYSENGSMHCEIGKRPEFIPRKIFKLNPSRIYDIRSGKLLTSVHTEDGGGDWTAFNLSEPLSLSKESPFLVVTLEEKKRFVSMLLGEVAVDAGSRPKDEIGSKPQETPEEMAERIRVEGGGYDGIVYALINNGVSPAKAGELATYPPERREISKARELQRDKYRKSAERAYEREAKRKGL